MSILAQNIQEGLDYLGIKDSDTILYIIKANIENYFWVEEEKEKKKKREEYNNRFNIPKGKTKKEYEKIKKETRKIIEDLDKEFNNSGRENIFIDLEIENYIEKQNKLKAILKNNNNFGSDISKAKAYPIENLIEFNTAGFAKCLWHNEKSPSLKLYKSRNKCHCFSCGKDADSIDAYIIINNCSINEAIKNLK